MLLTWELFYSGWHGCVARTVAFCRLRLERYGWQAAKGDVLPHPDSAAPVIWKIGLSLAQDFEDRFAIGRTHPREFRALIRARQDGIETTVHAITHRIGQRIELGAVNQITERVTEQPCLQIEIPQAPAATIARTAL